MKLTKQTVYLPVNSPQEKYVISDNDSGYFNGVIEQEAFVLTPEQLNEYTQAVIKQALETATHRAELTSTPFSDWCLECSRSKDLYISSESITNTFDETYKIFEV